MCVCVCALAKQEAWLKLQSPTMVKRIRGVDNAPLSNASHHTPAFTHPANDFPLHTCNPTTSQHTLSRELSCKLDLVLGWKSVAPAKDEEKNKFFLTFCRKYKILSGRQTEAPASTRDKNSTNVFIIYAM